MSAFCSFAITAVDPTHASWSDVNGGVMLSLGQAMNIPPIKKCCSDKKRERSSRCTSSSVFGSATICQSSRRVAYLGTSKYKKIKEEKGNRATRYGQKLWVLDLQQARIHRAGPSPGETKLHHPRSTTVDCSIGISFACDCSGFPQPRPCNRLTTHPPPRHRVTHFALHSCTQPCPFLFEHLPTSV